MPSTEPFICIGLMSGTSMDGVDAIAADFSQGTPVFRGRAHEPFPGELRQELLSLCRPGENELERAGAASQELARCYARAVKSLLAAARIPASEVKALGAHGQTVRHCPDRHFSIQLNSPALLAELTGIDVIADFRNADLAAGGEGAPLVPAFHERIFRSSRFRVIVNIGGIANLTILPPTGSGEASGFDCGPGNILMDSWCNQRTGRLFDEDGAWARSGSPIPDLLDAMLSEPFFSLPPPKSTGRELFNAEWLKDRVGSLGGRLMRGRDIQATLLQLTARGIADAIIRYAPAAEEVYLCGGGALNGALRSAVSALLPAQKVDTTESLGVKPMDVEGLAFAWLAYAWLNREPANCPAVTGASGPRILGALYPAHRK
ncbi:MAG: anhydro-N-acetylmuramic acid kinase [Sutterellaceae bacterium]|nr:anhydro-N-acetylmuramic acid kinase [Sutterellaceae bacterium]MDD7442183.1 anhydro-N-acetylmuramic acid kinase [Sutterellaceae bacterium]MDY2868178.1 anhydro-N-acetylmuramic acid kinase [Mesosutterella sp.]